MEKTWPKRYKSLQRHRIMAMRQQFKFADSISMRLVQIFQEAIMTGIDGADLLRQVRMEPDASDPNVLVLTPEYQRMVKESFEKLEARAKELQATQTTQEASSRFFTPGHGNN